MGLFKASYYWVNMGHFGLAHYVAKGEAGKDGCRWWRRLNDTVWHSVSVRTAVVTREYVKGGRVEVWLQGVMCVIFSNKSIMTLSKQYCNIPHMENSLIYKSKSIIYIKRWSFCRFLTQQDYLISFSIHKSITADKCLHYFSTSDSHHLLLPFALRSHVRLDQNSSELTVFFFHLGLELWIPGQCLLLMLITIRGFPDGTPKKYSPLLLPGKHCRAPSLIQSEKISGEMFRRVSARFPAENVWLLFAFGSGTPLPSEGCWGSSGKWLRSWDPEGEKLQILQGGAGCAGPLV